MKNRMISVLLATVLLFSLPITAFAANGDGNVDGGGGGMGEGTSQNSWTPGNDGVRVRVVTATTGATTGATVSSSIDYSNKSPLANIIHFGKKSKIQYRNGSGLSVVKGGYVRHNPTSTMPTILSSNGNFNIDAVKRYFCSEGAALMVANDTGINYEQLISGNYKLFIEPIAYFKYLGNQFGMTAHEAALYDQIQNGDLRSKMASLTHQNLPLAMFLERSDIGFPAWNGSTSGKQPNATIITSLGMGIVSYTELPPLEPDDTTVEYRVNTQVVTAVTLSASKEINPDSPATVTFRVGGQSYTMSNIVIPTGESQLVWCKWETPSTEQNITVSVSANKGQLSENVVLAKIVNLDKNPPPDPQANDRNDSFRAPIAPNNTQKAYASWSVWWAKWHPYWVWISDWEWCSHGKGEGHWVDRGWWEDQGWYDFFTDAYNARLSASSSITPDSKNPTASGKSMKSGYGVNNKVQAFLFSNAPGYHVTGAQTAVSYFPEFSYQSYWRLLARPVSGFGAQFEFKQNKYSTYNQKCHFSPIWYPNGAYNVYTYVQDAWTPAGMLSVNLNDSISISGSVIDDWHIAPTK